MARSILVLAGIVAAGCSARTAAPRAAAPTSPIDNHEPERRADPDHPLGLAEGVTWRFTGSRTVWDDDRQQEITEKVELTTRVTSARVDAGRQVFRIRDWPADVLGDGGVETVITIEAGVAYLGDPLAGDPWLRLPLAAGDGPGCIADEPYCWRVETSGSGFDVIYRTNPDITIYHLEPGRGVTGFEYHHHGTTDDVVLERVNDD